MREAVEYFCGDELAAEVWTNKYALRNADGELLERTPDDTHRRLAREFARVEKNKFKKPYSEDFLFSLFKDFQYIIPQGSPMYGVGNPYQCVSLSNCYTIAPVIDSFGGIHLADEQLSQISKRRGGVGIDISGLRPDGFATQNAARTSSGIVTFMERFSNSIREVGQNGRRGALMLTLSVHHPQVLDFARAKLDLKKVTGANVSIRLTDEFMEAVKENRLYEQRWPVEGEARFRREVPAREVWKEIVRCAWKCAEPGLLFWDLVTRECPADCYAEYGFKSVGCNPCAELILSANDSCRLLLLNLFSLVENAFSTNGFFDFKKFYEYAYIAQRLMDDLVDLELEAVDRILTKLRDDPEPEAVKRVEVELWESVHTACKNGRRTGTGQTALADALAGCGVRYGSEESVRMTGEIYRTLKLACYRSSVDMAKELGPFPVWRHDLEKDNPFLLRIRDEDPALWEDMKRHGRRNISLLTTPPAGSVSIQAGPRPYFQTTSGIEPLFMRSYTRRRKVNPSDVGARVDFVDPSGDRWQEYTVHHSKLRMWMDLNPGKSAEESPDRGTCAEELDWRMRVRLQAAASEHIDHSIASTINLPEDATEGDVAEIYETAWRTGAKGITVYRKNCRTGVLVEHPANGHSNGHSNGALRNGHVKKTHAPKRPDNIPCQAHRTRVDGQDFVVFVGLLGKDVYEVMACPESAVDYSPAGLLVKAGKRQYQYVSGDRIRCGNVIEHTTDEQEALTRMTSTALRHGADLPFVVGQLDKVRGSLTRFAKGLARVLKKYLPDGPVKEKCPECSSESVARQEGCLTCKSCGWSKCS